MIDVVFAFDVEDVVHPQSDDAALRLCDIFTQEQVPVSLFTAAEKARVLRQRGRLDVIEAMRRHEICYHGNYWGDFPEPATAYGSRLSFDEAIKLALEIELPGLHDVAEITGQYPVAWCCHQAQQSLPLQYAYKLANVRCWAGGPRGWIMNWLSWGRSNCAISSQGTWSQRVDPMKLDHLKPPADPDADLRAVQAQFEQMASERDFITFVGHPVCWVTTEWGLAEQAVLFRHGSAGAYPRPAHFRMMQPRSRADQEAGYEFMRKLLRWIKSLDGVNVTNYAALCERDEQDPMQWVMWEQTVDLARRVQQRFNYLEAHGTSFSCADLMGIFAFAVQYCWSNGRWPDKLPVQHLLGPTEQPLHLNAPLTISREDVFAGALASYAIMMDERRIPGKLRASFTDVGPGEWLQVLAKFITEYADRGELPLKITIPATPMLPQAVDEPCITERRFGSSNMPAGMDFTHLWDLLKWQSWSYRPAVSKR
ncbi:MAG: hypothetical protein ACYC63_01030 [Armatimonadota bacterium]